MVIQPNQTRQISSSLPLLITPRQWKTYQHGIWRGSQGSLHVCICLTVNHVPSLVVYETSPPETQRQSSKWSQSGSYVGNWKGRDSQFSHIFVGTPSNVCCSFTITPRSLKEGFVLVAYDVAWCTDEILQPLEWSGKHLCKSWMMMKEEKSDKCRKEGGRGISW